MKKGIITIEFEVFGETDESIIKKANNFAALFPNLNPVIAEISEQMTASDEKGTYLTQRLIYNK